jgi:putative spermidine/putrescine transport system substrate-binding protein
MSNAFGKTRLGISAWVAGVVLLAQMGIATNHASAQNLKGQTLRLYTYGGSYLEAVRDLVIKPFEAETGVQVIVDDSCCAKLSAAMTAGQYVGDAILGQDHGRLLNYAKLGWLVPDKRFEEEAAATGSPASFKTPNFLLLHIYAYIMAGSDPNAPMPKTWAEFWDTDKFPGSRGLIRNEPAPQIEAALLAAGIAPDKLYPLDVDKALAKFDELRKKTKVVFAATGAEQINLLATKEAKYSIVFSNRVVLAANENIKLGYTYEQSLQVGNGGGIPKGSKNVDAAVAFLKFHNRPEVLAKFAARTGLAPAYPKAANLVEEARRPLMPSTPENSKTAVQVDVNYWGDHQETVHKRWVQWLAQ